MVGIKKVGRKLGMKLQQGRKLGMKINRGINTGLDALDNGLKTAEVVAAAAGAPEISLGIEGARQGISNARNLKKQANKAGGKKIDLIVDRGKQTLNDVVDVRKGVVNDVKQLRRDAKGIRNSDDLVNFKDSAESAISNAKNRVKTLQRR